MASLIDTINSGLQVGGQLLGGFRPRTLGQSANPLSIGGLKIPQSLLGAGLLAGGAAASKEPGEIGQARQFLRNQFTSPTALSEQFAGQLGGLKSQFQPLLDQQRQRDIEGISQRFAAAFPSHVGAQGPEFGTLARYITDQALPREQGLMGHLGLDLMGQQQNAARDLLHYGGGYNPWGPALSELGGSLLANDLASGQGIGWGYGGGPFLPPGSAYGASDLAALGLQPGSGGSNYLGQALHASGGIDSTLGQRIASAYGTTLSFDPLQSGNGLSGYLAHTSEGQSIPLEALDPTILSGGAMPGPGRAQQPSPIVWGAPGTFGRFPGESQPPAVSFGAPGEGAGWATPVSAGAAPLADIASLPSWASAPQGEQAAQYFAANAGLPSAASGTAEGFQGLLGSPGLSSAQGLAAGIGAAGLGYGAGRAVGGYVGGKTNSQALGALSGAGTGAAVGFALGGPTGAAVGAIAGAVGGFGGTQGAQHAMKAQRLSADISSQQTNMSAVGSFWLQQAGAAGADIDALKTFYDQQNSILQQGPTAFSFDGISGTADQQDAFIRVASQETLKAIQRARPEITSFDQLPGFRQAYIDELMQKLRVESRGSQRPLSNIGEAGSYLSNAGLAL